MKNIIKLEEAAMFGICIYTLYILNAEWWYYLILILGPDISMIGYTAGNRAGGFLQYFSSQRSRCFHFCNRSVYE